jgi:predicted GIY-YIG superfamily endonuclease
MPVSNVPIGVSGLGGLRGIPAPLPRPCVATYRFYDNADRLLYVGVTDNPGQRFTQHRNATWGYLAQTFSLEWFRTRGRALSAEHHAIEREGPLYNGDRAECFEGTAADARAAIPGHLERFPTHWRVGDRGLAPWPSRFLRWEIGDLIVRMPLDIADQLARAIAMENPELHSTFDGERAGVPDPWGAHAVINYALIAGLVTIGDVRGDAPERPASSEETTR